MLSADETREISRFLRPVFITWCRIDHVVQDEWPMGATRDCLSRKKQKTIRQEKTRGLLVSVKKGGRL